MTALRCTVTACSLALLWAARPALAHHSGSMFDMEHESTVEGTIKDFQWTNPHCWLLLDVPSDGGGSNTWAFEAGPPSIMSRMGLKKSEFVGGEKVMVHAWLMKDNSAAGLLRRIDRADGSTLTVAAFDKP